MPSTHGVRHMRYHNAKRHIHLEPIEYPYNDQPNPTALDPASVVRRAPDSTSTCSSDDSSCHKSNSSAMTTTLPVVLGAVIPIVCAVVVLFLLHRRHVRKLRAEDANDKHRSLDFGMEVVRAGGQSKGGTNPEMGEKPHKRGGGLSLDIINSPYLLPPGLQNSKESLRSLTKVISADDDKYRLAAHSDNASLHSYRSHPKWAYDDTSSVGGSTKHLPTDDMRNGLLQNAQRMSRSSPPKGSPPPDINPHAQNPTSMSGLSKSTSLSDASVVDAHLDMPKDDKVSALPSQEQPLHMKSSGESAQSHSHEEHDAGTKRLSVADTGLGGFNFGTEAHQTSPQHETIPTIRETPSDTHVAPTTPRISLPLSDAASDYGDDVKLDQFPSVNVSKADEKPHEAEDVPPATNRMTQRFTRFDEGFDPHRLTVGIRPLPPEDPADNPEQRANRIRSFYKEYFDDTKGGANGGGQEEYYYEDFGSEFYDDPGVYDPYYGDYMTGPPKPFAEPMGRRAMTPPPRFQGPPRTMHSSAGFRSPGPRAFSSASGRLPVRAPPKPMPLPEPLHVLPSPSLMSDDMSVLPIDYAPGKTLKDQQAGRPDSPRGGLRPYTPAMPARSPLASSFDDLAAIPSPHALRKSGVFMPLDFAPPPRFKNDTGSDAGSIRSNRSGISAIHMHNIRAGAYRVSRLPADTVGTRDDINTSLRPKWDMR